MFEYNDPWIISIVLLLSIAFVNWLFFSPFNKLEAAGIRGPKPWPIIGNLLDFTTKEANVVEKGYVEKYGKVCGYYFGRDPQVLVADPKILHRIMLKDFHMFPNRPAVEIKLLYGPGQRSMLHLKDDDWKRIRAIISPVFSGAKMKQMVPVIEESLGALLEIIDNHADTGESCDVFESFSLYTMETMLSLAFGIKTETQKEPNNPYSESAKAFFRVDYQFLLAKIIPFYGKILHWTRLILGPPPYIKFLAEASLKVIHNRRLHGKSSDTHRKDLLDLMLSARVEQENGKFDCLTDEDIVGQAITFMLAGHETTANSISFTAFNLALHPEYQERVLLEIDDNIGENEEINYETLTKLEYLDMCFSENMRLYSPAFRFDRVCKESCTINGVNFKAGFNVGFAVSHIHMNPEYWPEPEKFNPERFTAEAKAKRDPFCYLPFGDGPRSCVGMRFTYFQAKMVLSNILRKYKFVRALDTEVPPKRTASLGLLPLNGVRLLIQKRK